MRTKFSQHETKHPPASPKPRQSVHPMGEMEEPTGIALQRSPRLRSHTRRFDGTYDNYLDNPVSSRVRRHKQRPVARQESDEGSTSDLEDDESYSITQPQYMPEANLPVCPTKQTITGILIFVVLCFVVLISVYCTSYSSPSDNKHENLEFSMAESRLRKEIRVLRERFPSQELRLWGSFVGGIKKIVEDEPNKPSVFLLLHQEDRGTSECLAKEVGKAAAKFLKDGQQDLVEIDGSELKNNRSILEDYGVFTDQFRSSMERIGVMIVNNLQEIPGTIAQTFHTFCDEINPLVEKAVYFFTLRTTSVSRKSPVEVAEETLASLWKNHLDRDRMDPLIVRITSKVVVINPEKETPCRK